MVRTLPSRLIRDTYADGRWFTLDAAVVALFDRIPIEIALRRAFQKMPRARYECASMVEKQQAGMRDIIGRIVGSFFHEGIVAMRTRGDGVREYRFLGPDEPRVSRRNRGVKGGRTR